MVPLRVLFVRFVRFAIVSFSLLSWCYTAHSATIWLNGAGSSTAPYDTKAKGATSISVAVGAMSGGDTLIIADGTYTGRLQGMPSGSAGAYTQVRAENNFAATITIASGTTECLSVVNNYIRVEGINFVGNPSGSNSAGVATINGNHNKIVRCSFTGAGTGDWNIIVVTATNADYVLFEECWAWGTGRYKFLAYQSDHVIFRRCVARHDLHPSTQCATFVRYDSQYVDFQNCISIDGPETEGTQTTTGILYGGFWCENNAVVDTAGKNLGCIVLNLAGDLAAYSDPKIYGTRTIENCVSWDTKGGYYSGALTGPGYITFNHCLFGKTIGESQDTSRAWGCGVTCENGLNTATINNSILLDNYCMGLNRHVLSSDYNSLYLNLGNGNYPVGTDYGSTGYEYGYQCPAGVNDKAAINSNAIDPRDGTPGNGIASLKYLVRIETGSDLKGAGSSGSDIGPTILKKYGTADTLWGETGYETLTDDDLWPFPNEDEIRTDMKAFSMAEDYSTGSYWNPGGNPASSGDRGFCADGTTMTKYIWEYLGNTIPEEIYGVGGDETAPATTSTLTATAGSGNGEVDLAWTAPGDDATTGTATSYDVRYSTSDITSDGQFSAATEATGEPSPSIAGTNETMTVSGLTPGTTYYFALKTSDEVPNVSALSNSDSATATTVADTTAPIISAVGSLSKYNSLVISWTTNEAATSQVEYGVTSAYGQSVGSESLDTSHDITVPGLEQGTKYYWRVISSDAESNTATGSAMTRYTASVAGRDIQIGARDVVN